MEVVVVVFGRRAPDRKRLGQAPSQQQIWADRGGKFLLGVGSARLSPAQGAALSVLSGFCSSPWEGAGSAGSGACSHDPQVTPLAGCSSVWIVPSTSPLLVEALAVPTSSRGSCC